MFKNSVRKKVFQKVAYGKISNFLTPFQTSSTKICLDVKSSHSFLLDCFAERKSEMWFAKRLVIIAILQFTKLKKYIVINYNLLFQNLVCYTFVFFRRQSCKRNLVSEKSKFVFNSLTLHSFNFCEYITLVL